MNKPSCTSVCILSFAFCLSLGALGGQQPPAASDKAATAKDKVPTSTDKATGDKTSTRNRVAEPSGSLLYITDEKFVTEAARRGMMEIQLGQTAQQKASSAAVKDLGKKLEQDHTQAGKELAALAKAKNVSTPADVGGEKAMMDKLSEKSGSEFDKAYLKHVVRGHKKEVKEFEHEAADGIDSDVKAFATKTLPTLKEHLRMAEELEKGPKQ